MAESFWISRGFLLAGAVNIFGVLLFSKGFTNAYLSELDPQVFSTFGLIAILLPARAAGRGRSPAGNRRSAGSGMAGV